uniref:Solute carrier family 22 member 13b n=1 Tax=Oreochromis niloticus TaxID=8128 RepID=A0A669CTJ8_ORENI
SLSQIILERLTGINKPLCVILVYFTALEWTDPSKSAFCTMSIIAFFAVGQILLAGIAYLIQNWRILQLVLFCPLVIVLVAFYRLLPESEEALKELQRAARVNKKKTTSERRNVLDIFRISYLRKRFLIMGFDWFATSLLFYGLSLNVGNFGLNIYLTQLIFAVVEIPANLCGLTLIQRFGRRICQACFLLFGGAACLVVLAVPKDLSMVVTVLAVLGKFSATASFSTAYVYTAELYPTVLRQNGVGLNSMCARVAGIVAPLIRLLESYHHIIPMLVYGITPFAAGCFSFLLPETLNVELLDHTEMNQKLSNKPPPPPPPHTHTHTHTHKDFTDGDY